MMVAMTGGVIASRNRSTIAASSQSRRYQTRRLQTSGPLSFAKPKTYQKYVWLTPLRFFLVNSCPRAAHTPQRRKPDRRYGEYTRELRPAAFAPVTDLIH